jgi:hypothetical protein
MKRFLLFVMLFAWLGGALSAQNIPVLDGLTRNIVSELDKSSLQTGILLQQAPIWVNPFRYVHDSTYSNFRNGAAPRRLPKSFRPMVSLREGNCARLR